MSDIRRQRESRSIIKDVFKECFAVYVNYEPEKGDSWRDITIAELETLFYKAIYDLKNTKDESEKEKKLKDIVNFSLMIISKMQDNQVIP